MLSFERDCVHVENLTMIEQKKWFIIRLIGIFLIVLIILFGYFACLFIDEKEWDDMNA